MEALREVTLRLIAQESASKAEPVGNEDQAATEKVRPAASTGAEQSAVPPTNTTYTSEDSGEKSSIWPWQTKLEKEASMLGSTRARTTATKSASAEAGSEETTRASRRTLKSRKSSKKDKGVDSPEDDE